MVLNKPQTSLEKFTIPTTTRLGYVHLTVNSLDREIMFYTQVLGFTVHSREGSEAALGTQSEILLRLSENPAARRVQNTTGMYHFAILYPSRKELARAIARLFVMRYPNSPTDHGISKTTYLDDLEGNTIELYVRSLEDGVFDIVDGEMVVRYADGRIGSGRDPLDLDALFRELTDTDRLDLPLSEGTRIGHMHLYASGLQSSMDFYTGMLGFETGPMIENFRMGEVALDEQQPHVIAFNTWKGTNIPAPADALGLQYFTIVLPSTDDLQRVVEHVQAAGIPTEQIPAGLLVRDPSHIGMLLTDHMPPVG